MGSGVGARGSDVTARPRAPISASGAGAQVGGEAGGQGAGARLRGRAAKGSAAGFPGGGGGGGSGRAAQLPMRRWVWTCGPCAEAGLRQGRRPGSLQRVGEDADSLSGRSCWGSTQVARTRRKSHSTTPPHTHPAPHPALTLQSRGRWRIGSLPLKIALHPSLRSEPSLPDGEPNRKGQEMRGPAAIRSPSVPEIPLTRRTA